MGGLCVSGIGNIQRGLGGQSGKVTQKGETVGTSCQEQLFPIAGNDIEDMVCRQAQLLDKLKPAGGVLFVDAPNDEKKRRKECDAEEKTKEKIQEGWRRRQRRECKLRGHLIYEKRVAHRLSSEQTDLCAICWF